MYNYITLFKNEIEPQPLIKFIIYEDIDLKYIYKLRTEKNGQNMNIPSRKIHLKLKVNFSAYVYYWLIRKCAFM